MSYFKSHFFLFFFYKSKSLFLLIVIRDFDEVWVFMFTSYGALITKLHNTLSYQSEIDSSLFVAIVGYGVEYSDYYFAPLELRCTKSLLFTLMVLNDLCDSFTAWWSRSHNNVVETMVLFFSDVKCFWIFGRFWSLGEIKKMGNLVFMKCTTNLEWLERWHVLSINSSRCESRVLESTLTLKSQDNLIKRKEPRVEKRIDSVNLMLVVKDGFYMHWQCIVVELMWGHYDRCSNNEGF